MPMAKPCKTPMAKPCKTPKAKPSPASIVQLVKRTAKTTPKTM
jgi:hypothetical protein